MTQPTHGLDPNALEAAESAYAAATMDLPRHECENCGGSGVIITGRARGEHADANTCQACGGGGVVVDFPEGWNPMASAITAYLVALSQNPGTSNTSGEAVGVKVKPLEWGPESGLGFHRADTPFGQYVIMTKLPPIPEVTWWFGIRHGNDKMAPSLAEAKAAAQADFEQRILAALEPRASDRGADADAIIEECAKHFEGVAQASDVQQVWAVYNEFAKELRSYAAIRKLSEVSHV